MGIGSGDKAVLLLGFESFCAENFDYQMSILLRICQNYGGQWDYKQIKTKVSNQNQSKSIILSQLERKEIAPQKAGNLAS